MLVYGLPAILVFLYGLQAFLGDRTTPNTHAQSWAFLVLMALLWPIALPSIIWKKAKGLGKTQPAIAKTNDEFYQRIAS